MRIKDLFSNNQHTEIIIFGENHFKFDEVSRIRDDVVKFQPEVILHELYWEEQRFFSSKLKNTPVLPLEKEVIPSPDLVNQFKVREKSMIKHMDIAKRKFKRIAIIVGDTHLRTIDTPELGDRSPLNRWAIANNAKIIRSNYKEIS